ncbi:hypothetical protein [Pseudoxanthomonas wuyuanensis]|uniref:Uncharacterized protein n=1 Tax=Pseudoxanthomonas wuyuanensis TaxID=1073196 RepID=A0A286CZ55_9GAMM|nr:hypothetical protein [Pseudoxanthomonas wuyuanensis]KAF1722292.1 hypothetical protein CSC75_03395 [Pseudoxanthomonas wuyuanensis]SOD51683.1 hypothetical protein SAMN06296416_101809 [Pseudoxanthomonas wuyuanensis]
MKLQIEGQALRFRIDEAELAGLLAGDGVSASTSLAGGVVFAQSVTLADVSDVRLSFETGLWKLVLPQAAVAAYSQRLPCREGLVFTWADESADTPLQITFEVDVRDSVRQRIGSTRKPRQSQHR